MGMVIVLRRHGARASVEGVNPKTEGSASLPFARNASAKTMECSAGIRSRAIQLNGALLDLRPAIEQAAIGPPTASITSLTVDSILFTRRDNSRSVSKSSTHGLRLANHGKAGTIDLAMYSKKAAAKRLIQTQEALELTNAAISAKLDIASNAWSQYRTGERTIPHKALVSLKEQFGVTADWILAGDPSGLPQRLYAKLRLAA